MAEDFYENAGLFLANLKDAEKLYGMGETIAAAEASHKAEAAAAAAAEKAEEKR